MWLQLQVQWVNGYAIARLTLRLVALLLVVVGPLLRVGLLMLALLAPLVCTAIVLLLLLLLRILLVLVLHEGDTRYHQPETT